MSSKSLKPKLDLVNSPFVSTLARLAAPNLAATLIQSLLSIVEAWYIGGLGKIPLAGVALVFPFFMLAGMLSAGAIGGSVSGATARAVGAGDRQRAEAILRIAVLIAIGGAAIMSFLFLTYGREIYGLLGGKGEVLDAAVGYSDTLMAGVVTIWLFNMLSAVLRGSGDMVRPAIGITMITAIHFPVAGILISGWGPIPAMGMNGGAAAIVIAYGAGALAMFAWLCRPSSEIRLKLSSQLSSFAPRSVVVPLLKSGTLAANQSFMTIGIALMTTAMVGRLGTEWLAGYGIGVRLELLMVPVIFGFGGALIAIVGANVGAGNRERAIRMAWSGAVLTSVLVGSIGVTLSIFPALWYDMFTDIEAIGAACALYLAKVGPFYCFFAIGLCLYFCSQGLNTLLLPVIGTLVRFSVIAGGLVYFSANQSVDPEEVFTLVSIALVLYGVVISSGLWFGSWRRK